MNYYTETFTGDGNKVIHAYGEMDAHNHDRGNSFAKDIIAYLATQGWKNTKGSNYKSNQPKPDDGKLFVWKAISQKKGYWVKG